MPTTVDQSGASASGDIVGGKKEVHHHYPTGYTPSGIVDTLVAKLNAEMEKNEKIKHTIEKLSLFYVKKSLDGITGLEAKLKKGNREYELISAFEKKELFAKLLEKWSLYASAQEILAYLLAKADYEYTAFIYPQIGKVKDAELNQLFHDHIVQPTLSECPHELFALNHSVVMGMVYWLAEQCFVRWHQ